MNRRALITGLISLVASPAIVRVANIMPVKQMLFTTDDVLWTATKPETWHASFWIRGLEYQLGDTFGMMDREFSVNHIESLVNDRGHWQHVMGSSI